METSFAIILALTLVVVFACLASGASYLVDDSGGLGPRFDGIGGLSGGGATSRLLVSYPDPERSQILDYLFSPNFGASLHMLKVEIGGDAQSTEGTEPSHMHSPDDENYQRGYEWWLMKEAKKRNPDIKLYALPWGWPGWVGNYTNNPYTDIKQTIRYVMKWLQGAKNEHGLTIDYLGIWNERAYNKDYIKQLRQTLDSSGMMGTQIVAADGGFAISQDVLHDIDLAKAIQVLGFHYPGTYVTNYTTETRKTLWSSEDYSTKNDNVGAGCWARILNQNYVNGNMTSTISWNLIASYYGSLPYGRCGLMTAEEPWSGNYEVDGPIWITAHTTQFSLPGWKYYLRGSGSGHLKQGGSYVSLTDSNNLTIIIETMTHDHSICIRPPLPPYTVQRQTATFTLKGMFASIKSLNVFYSKPGYGGNFSVYFSKKSPIQVMNGQFNLTLDPDEIYTLTTLTNGMKGKYPDPPPSKPFPTKYTDNFDEYPVYSEANFFTDQAGCFEIRDSGNISHNNVMQQVATSFPVSWCSEAHHPIAVIGNHTWRDVSFSIDVNVPSLSGAILAVRVDVGGCQTTGSEGIFFWIGGSGKYNVTSDMEGRSVVKTGTAPTIGNTWATVQLTVIGGEAKGSINGVQVFDWDNIPAVLPHHGWMAIGTSDYSPVQFDNFAINSAS
nr:galactocerebrosidase-like isoform X2 [Lytechinus pictus]